MMKKFQYHPKILEKFPQVVGGVILASELKNGPPPQALQEIYRTEQRAVIARIGNTPLSEIKTLTAWRNAFRVFGVNPTQYRSAAEALLRRLTKKGDIPSLNAIVDICNLVSIRYGLPVAAFDTRLLTGPITVQFAEGIERFMPLFETEAEHPEPGEVIFSDDAGLVVARRWCWRQSHESATQADTTGAIFTVESQHSNGRPDIEAAVADLLQLLADFIDGRFTTGIIDAHNPTI